jgi:formylglycine-generating enzyme required for sulfatase activity
VPLTIHSINEAVANCATRGLQLTTIDQLQLACEGPNGFTYPYGMANVEGACNDAESGFGGPAKTGEFPQCISGFGNYDLVGNYWEAGLTETGSALFGGSTNSPGPSCTTTGYEDLAEGFTSTFRCVEEPF